MLFLFTKYKISNIIIKHFLQIFYKYIVRFEIKNKMIAVVKSKKEKIFEKTLEIGLNSTSHGLPNLI